MLGPSGLPASFFSFEPLAPRTPNSAQKKQEKKQRNYFLTCSARKMSRHTHDKKAWEPQAQRKSWERKKKRNELILWLWPKHWITTKQREEVTLPKSRAKGDLLHGVSAIPVKTSSEKKKFRVSRVTRRCVKQREKKGPPLGVIQQGGQRKQSKSQLLSPISSKPVNLFSFNFCSFFMFILLSLVTN